eukprot:scaffold2630_cov118-Isochrysis_galbana.AAC.2
MTTSNKISTNKYRSTELTPAPPHAHTPVRWLSWPTMTAPTGRHAFAPPSRNSSARHASSTQTLAPRCAPASSC